MLTRLAVIFVLHILALGILLGRRTDLLQLRKLRWVFIYFLLFYIAWGMLFAVLPELIMPEGAVGA